jgi:tRNA uracil 4-sulfurtransferase
LAGASSEARGWRVDLSAPELTIHVEALTNEAFYSFGKEPGAGGLPVGVSGKVACLLSGGIDSPVAAWRMMRRGCRVLLVHFHSYPILSRASQEKARELAAYPGPLPAPLAADASSPSARSSSRSCSAWRRRCAW